MELSPVQLRLCCCLLAIAFATFIFELFMFRFFGGYPDHVMTRLVGVATARLQTPACVNRTCRALHPHGHVWLWSESRRGICDTYRSPALDKTDLLHFNNRRFPLARIRGRIKTHE